MSRRDVLGAYKPRKSAAGVQIQKDDQDCKEVGNLTMKKNSERLESLAGDRSLPMVLGEEPEKNLDYFGGYMD